MSHSLPVHPSTHPYNYQIPSPMQSPMSLPVSLAYPPNQIPPQLYSPHNHPSLSHPQMPPQLPPPHHHQTDITNYVDPSLAQSSPSFPDDKRKNFQVVIRIRPPLPREFEGPNPYRDCVKIDSNSRSLTITELVETPINNSHSVSALNSVSLPSTVSTAGAAYRFTFDQVYAPSAQQTDIYRNTARDAVLSTLQGYNATILAYGQTGTGKTFTMEGFDDPQLSGIIPRSIEEIFNCMLNS
jgi:hypothetical protein